MKALIRGSVTFTIQLQIEVIMEIHVSSRENCGLNICPTLGYQTKDMQTTLY